MHSMRAATERLILYAIFEVIYMINLCEMFQHKQRLLENSFEKQKP